MKFLSSKELADKWNVDQSRILRLAYEGRIDGAFRAGARWMFPADVQKPADARTKTVRASKESSVPFRFPLYVNFEQSDYSPALSEEELQLRQGQLAFQACRFEKAEELLRPLSESVKNRYVRLSALYHRSYIAMYTNSSYFDALQWELNSALAQDFPHRKEMQLLHFGFDADNTLYRSVLEEFTIDPSYAYHPSAYYTLQLLSFIPIQGGDFSLMKHLRYDTQELLCQQMERDGYYLEAQKMHYLCSVVFQLQNNEEKMAFHIRRGLELGQQHEFYFAPAYYERFYPKVTRTVLKDFPEDFSRLIISFGSKLQKDYTRFLDNRTEVSFLGLLSSEDYEYAFLANQGYTNAQVAGKLHRSEKQISRRYSEIYDKLGVKNKQELVELINSTHRRGQV